MYTVKANIPQYEPKNTPPKSLMDTLKMDKFKELMAGIEKSGVSPEEKQFLKIAAFRHVVFNYGKIADYYACATPEMQRLMEDSALVIIDMDDAIAKGYVRLSESIKKIVAKRLEDEGKTDAK